MWFGKKKEEKNNGPKVKPLSEREIQQNQMKEAMNRVIGETEQLAPGQILIYKLPEFYWNGFTAFIVAELNPDYPKKGKKYIMSLDSIKDGNPAGNKRSYFESNNPKSYAEAVIERHGERFV